jgi:CRISPR system Cascade subunit CasD
LGLVGAALGIDRSDVANMVALHRSFGVSVRVDQPGTRGIDFHTAQQVPRAERGMFPTVVTRRSYLHDAEFVVVIGETDEATVRLEEVRDALRYPQFAPVLGRRACPPASALLACPDVITGTNWVELLNAIPGAPTGAYDAYIEGAIAGGLRQMRVRDVLIGPLARTFGQRVLTHMRLPGRDAARDTVEAWFKN